VPKSFRSMNRFLPLMRVIRGYVRGEGMYYKTETAAGRKAELAGKAVSFLGIKTDLRDHLSG
jgi:hypothetical protein